MHPDNEDRMTPEDRLWVLAGMIRSARPNTGEKLPTPEFYAREILATDAEEQGLIRLGAIELTPLSAFLP